MTFDEWYHKNNDDSLCYQAARHAWNAAINAAVLLLESGDYYWPSVNNTGPDRQPSRASFAEVELKKLLTSK